MGKETAALLLIGVVHLAGVCVLLWALVGVERVDPRGWWPRDDGREPPQPLDSAPPGEGLAADPGSVRLRTEHDRLADVHRRRSPADRRLASDRMQRP